MTRRSARWRPDLLRCVRRSPLFPLAPLLGLGLTLAFPVAVLQDKDVGRPSVLLLAACIGLALLWSNRGAGGPGSGHLQGAPGLCYNYPVTPLRNRYYFCFYFIPAMAAEELGAT